jgi:hypothetical protein
MSNELTLSEIVAQISGEDQDCNHNTNFKDYDKCVFKKECSGYPYLPTILPKVKRIITFGDVHGDWKLTIKCLQKTGLIDNNLNWIGNDSVVVQVGDQIDRCRPSNHPCDHPKSTDNDEHSDIRILELFSRLHEQALKVGGGVYSLFGNHEFMNVDGNINYVSYQGLIGFSDDGDVAKGKSARIQAFKPGNKYGKFLGCTRTAAIIVGSFMFVHAGIIPSLIAKLGLTEADDLYKINFAVRRWLLGLVNKKYVDQIVGAHNNSMFWQRILGNIPPNVNNNDPNCVKYLDPVLKLFKIGHMVIGHTPQFVSNDAGINNTCGNSLWRVDIGACTAFNKFNNSYHGTHNILDLRQAQVLEILDDSKINVIKL